MDFKNKIFSIFSRIFIRKNKITYNSHNLHITYGFNSKSKQFIIEGVESTLDSARSEYPNDILYVQVYVSPVASKEKGSLAHLMAKHSK